MCKPVLPVAGVDVLNIADCKPVLPVAGVDVWHAVVNILLIYCLLLVCGGSRISIIGAFVINMVSAGENK